MNKNPKSSAEKTVVPLRHFETIKIYEDKSDQEIWKSFNLGDETAFNYIYRTYVKDLYRYGWQYSKDGDLVKDCIQNLFIYLRRKRGELSEVANIRAYLYRCIQAEISKNRKNEARFRHAEADYHEGTFAMEVSPETSLIDSESALSRHELLAKSLNQLTPKQRKALLLFYEDGLSYREISALMEFSEVKTARKLIYRAIASLKDLLKPTTNR
ncbi:sigma-70 family RNA polymerase sigma factor [Algoriphagus sp. H41]|uniref:Sigma-70 family RNA polymerase sigma factor n=1 Tax=Algoriphagus oliviformis TaxID=2811231 RepID=A0ABS3BYS2_9BACT|nr:sigma-70 family RNA polymerase sigma factor [Algoriphagus oliviformis]MBN7809961.1 sigma-70 family RNA polymerase sigma factor [Algoriphagus oliviformis]